MISSTLKLLPNSSESAEPPVIKVQFLFVNVSESLAIVESKLHFTQSFDVKCHRTQGQKDFGTEEDTVFIGGDLLLSAWLEEDIEFTVLGNARVGLCIRGDAKYCTRGDDDELKDYSANFELSIPVTTFMLAVPRIDPTTFSTLLAEHGSDFTNHQSTRFPLKHMPNLTTEQSLTKALETISQVTWMQIVEIVPGAASIYGRSIQGYQFAGLVKYTIAEDGEGRETIMNMDLRGGDEDFCKGLIKEVEIAFEV
jgi:AP-3 complex subunit delta-1